MKRLLVHLAIGASFLASFSAPSVAETWFTRTVSAVDGFFETPTPSFGFESGSGSPRIQWGNPVSGSFASFLKWEGYDAFPDVNQHYFPGQDVLPGQEFFAGYLTFGNGSVTVASSAADLAVAMDVNVIGSEFDRDTHPLVLLDTWTISIRQTANGGFDPVADADFIFFDNFPQLGSFRVLEGKTTRVAVYAKFGSIEPSRFGEVEDPSSGVVLPSIVDNPDAPGTVNQTPVAACRDVVVPVGPGCVADAFVDNGSFDPDGDAFALIQEPTGPYPVGVTHVTLTAIDSGGLSDSCEAKVTVLPMLGDLNGDCCVDQADLALLMAPIRARSSDLRFDINGDGVLNIADARSLALLFTNPGGTPCHP